MRELERRPVRASRTRQLHRTSSNMQLSRRRARSRLYDGPMPHVRDTDDEAKARSDFSKWIVGVVDSFAQKGVSKRQLAIKSGVNRNTIDRWIKKETFPEPDSVRTFCDALGLVYAEPARILGWSPAPEVEPAPTVEELGERISRAREIANDPRTSERRRRAIESQIEAAEQARRAAASSRVNAEQLDKAAESMINHVLEEPEDVSD